MLQGKYPLLIALVLGLLAALVSISAIRSAEKRARDGWDPVQVVCAAADVDEGTELDGSMAQTCPLPSRVVTESFIRIEEGEDPVSVVAGQRVLVPLKKGDPILYSHFESSQEISLSESVPQGLRAVAIEVTEKASVGQWIKPSDHVDVVGTFRDLETRELMAVTMLQNVVVLATGKITGNSTYVAEEDKRWQHAVLLVAPEEAEMVALASEYGSLTLTLRNTKDIEVPNSDRKKTDVSTLLTGQQKEIRAIREKIYSGGVDIIRGSSRQREGTGVPAAGQPNNE